MNKELILVSLQVINVVILSHRESQVFALNSLGNTVDRTVNNMEEIKKVCQSIQNEINEIKNKTNCLSIVKDPDFLL